MFSANHKKTVKSTEKKPAWHDEDDDDVKVKDVTGTYTKAIGKHGKKETSNENYAQSLRKQFSNLMDRPKWAKLEVTKDSEDSDDEFFRETTDTLATGKSLLLKKGFIESRKLKGTLVLFYLKNHNTFNEKVYLEIHLEIKSKAFSYLSSKWIFSRGRRRFSKYCHALDYLAPKIAMLYKLNCCRIGVLQLVYHIGTF